MNEPASLTPAQLASQQIEIGQRLLANGDSLKAEQRFRAAIGHAPDHVIAHAELARALKKSKKPDEALREIEIALQLSPRYAHCHYMRASLLLDKNRLREARQSLEQAIEISPRHATYHFLLSHVAWREISKRMANPLMSASGRTLHIYREVGEHLGRALELEPDHIESHRTMAALFTLANQREAAMLHLQTILRLNPEDAEAHAAIGKMLANTDEHNQAIEHLQESLRLNPHEKELVVKLQNAQSSAKLRQVRLRWWFCTFGRLSAFWRVAVSVALVVGLLRAYNFAEYSSLPSMKLCANILLCAMLIVYFYLAFFIDWFIAPPRRQTPGEDDELS